MARANKYDKLEELAKILGEIHELIGEEPKEMPELRNGGIMSASKRMCLYIDELTKKGEDILSAVKVLKLGACNNEETEKNAEACGDEPSAFKKDSLNGDYLDAVKRFIAYRDGLYAKKDYIAGLEGDNVIAEKLVDSQLAESAKLLESIGVTSMEKDELFDGEKHCAVDSIETDDPSKVGRIARIVRPGYLYGGEGLRVQEVVVYSK